jgi:hypothetical protein
MKSDDTRTLPMYDRAGQVVTLLEAAEAVD